MNAKQEHPHTQNLNIMRKQALGRRRGRPLRQLRTALLEKCVKEIEILFDIRLRDPDLAPQIPMLKPATFWPDNNKRLWLEIGFGTGEHMLGQMQQYPDVNFIGAEPFENGISGMLKQVYDNQTNADEGQEARVAECISLLAARMKLWREDARYLLPLLPDTCLERIYLLFPDPWPKLRHHKRRFIQAETIKQFARILKPGGKLLMATDHPNLADWMSGIVTEHGLSTGLTFEDVEWQKNIQTAPKDWIPTRYQEKALASNKTFYLKLTKSEIT